MRPPSSLRGRLALGFAVLGVTTWVTVGVALFVALRSLHTEATAARLADLSVPLVARVRSDTAAGLGLQAALDDLRSAAADTGTTGVSIHVVLADGRIVQVGGDPVTLPALPIDPALPAGSLVHSTVRVAGTAYVWSATVLRAGVRGGRALVVAEPDRAPAQALGDLVGTLPLALVATTVVGLLVVTWLSRSVAAPLARLSDAASGLAAGGLAGGGGAPLPPLLPHEGPTEVRRLTASFETMRDALAAARQREAELLADVRHDLRTPLTAISGFAAALSDGTATGPAAERAAGAIVAETARMAALIDDLGLAAGERRRELTLEPLDAGALVAATVDRFAGVAAEAGAILEARPPADGTLVVADRGSVERILGNLVRNALTAVAPTRGRVVVDAHSAEGAVGRSVVISVSDDGPGFPPGLTERAFDRFVRGDPARQGPGSGLGLAIVRELAEAHGGTAFAENLAPHGARVTVTLPAG